MKWINFLIYLMFAAFLSIGMGAFFKDENIGLSIFGVLGLLYLIIPKMIHYLDEGEL